MANEITGRDLNGRITEKSLDSQTAAELARLRWSKPREHIRNQLLLEAGYADPQSAPRHIIILASIASGEGSQAVAALRDYRKLAGLDKQVASENVASVAVPGTLCPTCGSYVFGNRNDAIAFWEKLLIALKTPEELAAMEKELEREAIEWDDIEGQMNRQEVK